MGKMVELLNSAGDASWLMLVSRAFVTGAWSLALYQIWKSRHAPMANQALVAALAIVMGQLLMVFHRHLSLDVLTFFVSMAQVSMAIATVKILRWISHITHSEQYRIQVMEDHRQRVEGCMKTYGSSMLTITIAGLIYFACVWIEQGHF